MNKEPSGRYDSAGALAADLERWLRGEPIRTRPASAAEKFRRWCGRKPALAGLGAGVVGLLLVVVIGSPLAAWRMDHLRARAEAEALEARRNLYVADMTLAEQACAVGDFGRAIELLEHHRPEANLPGAITRAQPDLRGWEWRYLWQLTRSDELATLGRHGSLVRALVFSPNGQTLASGGVNNIVRLWDVNMRRETASATLPAWISGLSYSPDGKWLVAASGRTQLTIWEAGSLREITTLRAINLSLTSTFSGDGTLLIAAAGGELKCWEAGSWKERPAILWEGSATNLPLVERVTLAPDNRMLAFNSEDGRIYLWDMERRQVVAVWPGHKPLQGFATMQALVYSPDGRMLVSAGADNQIIVWDPATRQQRRVLVLPKIGGREFWPHALAFSPDGKLLASAGANQRLALWDTTNWQLANVLKGHQDGVWSVAFSPDGRTLASGSKDETIRLWNPDAKPPDSPFHEFPDGTVTGMTSTDGRSELTLQKDSTAILRESASLREIARWPTARLNGVSARALSGGAKHVAFGYADGLISLSDAHNGRNLASWQAHEAKVHRLGFSLDATLLASVGEDGKLSLWDVATQRERWSAKLTSAITSPHTPV